MFFEEMEQILSGVPYAVWEQVIGAPVERVVVGRSGLAFSGNHSEMPIHVQIETSIETRILDGFESLDDPNRDLLRLWKPYRELIEQKLLEGRKILEENPPEFICPPISEREFDERLRRIKKGEGRLQLGEYIFRFHLSDELRKRCYTPDLSPEEAEAKIKDTAFDLILETIRKEKADLIGGEKPVDEGSVFEVTEEIRDSFDELMGYLTDVLETDWNEERFVRKLETFLYQDRSVKDLYREAEEVLEDVFSDLSERKKEYYRLTQMDRRLKKRVLSMKDDRIHTSWSVNGRNPFARGYTEGVFYGLLTTMYELCGKKEGWPDVRSNFLNGNPDLEPVLEAVEATAEEYFKEPLASFDEVESEIFFLDGEMPDGREVVYGTLEDYGITRKGSDRAEVFKKLRESFIERQKEERINQLLKLD